MSETKSKKGLTKKQLLLIVLAVVVVAAAVVAIILLTGPKEEEGVKFALVTDVGNIDDQSFNQSTWEGLVAFADANKLVKDENYAYYKPFEDSDDARIESITTAIDNGAKVVIVPGYLFNAAVLKAAEDNPEVIFIGVDLTIDPSAYPANATNLVFKEEQSGFMAGYAAVMDGYTKLGFLGGINVPAVVRYGFGYIQGIDYAAQQLGVTPEVKYWYANTFGPNDEIKAKMDSWYAEGTEIVFACGGGIFLSCLSAADTADGMMIGVDSDQGYISERFVTSAMKIIPSPLSALLQKIYDASYKLPEEYAGHDTVLSIVDGACGLPTAEGSWRFKSFTMEDYQMILDKVLAGDVMISDATDVAPETVVTTVDFQN
ncbi:MAG TPA: BMP family ABC transporter substrate-binding protein [Candidatus Limiplasma sp.]|nr:BMP family ABC transporter substrate-binding protein [Candidatus Limiplasma sp.]HRX08742.1 BMP family ABC transporter substrate-binding protein [Candidatus Limiplasma sp.]